ncbi:MAG: MFS transporter [Candidatus Paceibacterota bacterium]
MAAREIKILSLSFLLIFFGFNGVQQYMTTFFSEAGIVEVGFRSLILVYLSFIVFNPFSVWLISKFGSKKCMLLSSLMYVIFILSLLTKSSWAIYGSSVLLGISASLLWMGASCYLIRVSKEDEYGKNSGIFNSFQSFGSAAGVILLGFLVSYFSFNVPFLVFSAFPILGTFFILTLEDVRIEQKKNQFELIKKSITSKTAIRLSSIWFVANLSYGFVIGIIPIQIKDILGASFVGPLSFLFYALPILLSYFFGRLSDVHGRKIMIGFSYLLMVLGLLFLSVKIYFVLGIILLALNTALMKPITYALIGDVTTKDNLEPVSALFWMVQNVAVVITLFVSGMFKESINSLYYISILAIFVSALILLPFFKLELKEIKNKISQEVFSA